MKLFFIGVGWEQSPYIRKANNLGIDTYTTSPVFSRDIVARERLFNMYKPDAILSDACDYSLFTQSFLAHKYGLPGPDIYSATLSNNKFMQRDAVKYKVQQPDYRLCLTLEQAKMATYELGYPVVIKPIDSRGSLGVYKINNEEMLDKLFYESIKHSPARQLIVEQFVPGKIVTVEGLYADKFYNLTYSTKTMHSEHTENAMELRYPGNLDKETVGKLYAVNERVAEAFRINFGLMHSEFIINKDGIHFLESTNRGGGVHTATKIVPEVTGVDIPQFLINSAFGKKTKIKIKSGKHCFLHFFDFGVGMVKQIENYKKVQSIKGVLDFRLNFARGDYLEEITTAVSRPGFVIVSGDTVKDCKKTIADVEDTLKVII